MIGIVDYGMGNLRSVQKAFEFLGFQAVITEDKAVLRQAERIVLPGVGAFPDAMARLNGTGLADALKGEAASGKPLLGICLGMQLMFEGSEENGRHQGLGFFPGTFVHFPDMGLKIPHMGWNTLTTSACPLFESGEQPYVYFVHSFYMPDVSPEWTAATAEYGVTYTAAACRGNIMATQFHPEKSGAAGLEMLRRFACWKGENASC